MGCREGAAALNGHGCMESPQPGPAWGADISASSCVSCQRLDRRQMVKIREKMIKLGIYMTYKSGKSCWSVPPPLISVPPNQLWVKPYVPEISGSGSFLSRGLQRGVCPNFTRAKNSVWGQPPPAVGRTQLLGAAFSPRSGGGDFI
ncbi:hypothetical protein KIL84_014799 [Mauremys mutica]|uniref:Uncharacterized protein n=1 Tax=Mauremys mutica TaxID=74926 RepID=A0A9D4B7J2_9SAUR|nr:hypothetical protein KIL84_014799 [Mauremys mutica]